MLGKVKWFNKEKGYGFVSPVDGGKDVFIHHTALRKAGISELPDNTRIEYDEEETPKGSTAINLRLV